MHSHSSKHPERSRVLKGFTFDTIWENNPVNLVEKASRMKFGLDTESDGPLLLSPQLRPATKKNPPRLKYKNFLDMYRSTTVGYSIAFEDKTAYYVPLNHRKGNAPYYEYVSQLRALLGLANGTCYIHNLSHELRAFKQLGIDMPATRNGNLRCTALLAWITNNEAKGRSPYGLKALSRDFLDHEMSEFDTVVGGTGGSFGLMDPASPEAQEYACEDAVGALLLGKKFDARLEAYGLEDWYKEVELPFVWVLNECKDTGLSINHGSAEALHSHATKVAKETSEAFTELTGANLNSPKSMQILYVGDEEQGVDPIWPVVSKPSPKSGWYSTDKWAFEKLKAALDPGTKGHQALELLQEYRDVAKVKSTYSGSLIRLSNQYGDGKLHPDYMQWGTTTGRISSSYPNGTNMPARGAAAKPLMAMFEAPEGQIWCSSDYSQIDLRVLSHFSGGVLANAFTLEEDPHQATADLMGVSRDLGKTLNFAVVYGAQGATLARQLKVSKKEATNFRKKYMQVQPEIPELFQKIRDSLYRKGYVKTLSGRRRVFPLVHNRNQTVVADGFKSTHRGLITEDELFTAWGDERKAGNTVCQGGAADIVKKAMVDLYFAKPSNMLFQTQIHDDIRTVITGYDGGEKSRVEADDLAKLKRDVMENAWDLRVPLVAEPVLGKSWLDLKGEENVY